MGVELTLYHANWCGHCQEFKPVWNKVKLENKNQNIKFIDLEESELDKDKLPKIGRQTIRGFPTIKINDNGMEYEYNGKRTYKAFSKFINSFQ